MEQPVVLSKARLVIVVAVAGELAACSSNSSSFGEAMNPINWYRDVMGLSADDELGSGENDQNLQEGSKEPYPNLASVPNPPDTALSTTDQQKLVDSLIADRNNAKYSNERLVAGTAGTTATPPAPAAPHAPTPNAPPTTSAVTPPAPPTQATSNPPAAPPTPAPAPQAASSAPATRPGQPPKRGSEQPPAESSLTSPTVSSLPQGEAATPAPPLPQIPPPQGERVASAIPRATAPKLRPPGAGETETAAPATMPSAPRGAAISYHVADIRFAPGSALLGDKLGDTIAEIVKLHHESGGTIRIIGHGEAGGANAAVAGLNLALDRAQAVAVALTNNGVAAKEISVEAAPVTARGGSDVPRAEVYLDN